MNDLGMSKTRKNKTNLVVEWPDAAYFTIAELWALNNKFKEITLRVRLTNAIEDGKVAEIGSIPGGDGGRPRKVFALTPVTKIVLDKAESLGVTLVDKAREKLIAVVSVHDQQLKHPQAVPQSTIKVPVGSNAS